MQYVQTDTALAVLHTLLKLKLKFLMKYRNLVSTLNFPVICSKTQFLPFGAAFIYLSFMYYHDKFFSQLLNRIK